MPIALFLDTAFAILKRYRWLALVLPLTLALGLSHCSDKRHTRQRDEARATIAQMELASEQARDAQVALNADNQELHERIAADARTRHEQIAAATDSAIDAYARSHGVRSYCEGSARRADPAPLPDSPGAPSRAPDLADMVAVSRPDLEALSKAALHGDEATSFLIDQVNAGLAIPEPAF